MTEIDSGLQPMVTSEWRFRRPQKLKELSSRRNICFGLVHGMEDDGFQGKF
jgi:hypothetical protein